MTASDEVLVCSGCGLPFRRNPEGLLVHLEPWCAAMVNGGECPRPIAAAVKLEAIHEEPNDAAGRLTWLSLRNAGFSRYESADDGFGPDQRPIRRVDNGRPLKPTVGTHGYLQVKLYNDQNKQETRTVHSLVMLPRVGPCPPGMQTRHYDDDPFNNRWAPGGEALSVAAGGNLFYGTQPEQEEDKYRNGRPRAAPRPERHCVLCGAILTTNGKRCHDCVVALGVNAAGLLRGGHDPADVAATLDYPSAEGIVKLAVVHGGYGQSRLKRWLHTVAAKLGVTDGDR